MRRAYLLLFLSAVLCALPMTFPSFGLLSFVALVPLFFVLLTDGREGNLGKAALRGLFFGFFYHALIYFWFLWLYPLSFAGLDDAASLGVVLLAWLGISFFHGALYAIPFLMFRFFAKWFRGNLFPLCSAVFGFLLAEGIPSLSQLAFPWVRLSLGLYRMPLLIQFASVFGILGVDLLLMSVSAALAFSLCAGKGRRRIACAFAALFLFLFNLGFGVLSLAGEKSGETLTVSLVQGSVLSGEKWSGQNALNTYTSLTEEIEYTDLVVWPESAVPVNLAEYPALMEAFQELSDEIDAPLVTGCFWKDGDRTTNSAVYLDSDFVSRVYSKRHLVPFGERMPYRSVLSKLVPVLEEINMLSEDLASGKDSAVMETPLGKLGGIICFESLFPSLTRASVKDGAELIVLVTNDSWYKDSPGVWQHLAHSVFRSVENGRSTVRCANSGVSAFIDENGRIKSELGPLKKGVLTDEVTLSEKSTVYTKTGDLLLPLCTLVWLCLGASCLLTERRRNRA